MKSLLWSTFKKCRLATGRSEVTTTDIFRNTCCQGKVSKLVLHAGYSYFHDLKFYYKNDYLFAELLITIYIFFLQTSTIRVYIFFYFDFNSTQHNDSRC